MSEPVRWAPTGALNFDTSAALLRQAKAVAPDHVDLSGVTEADSTALALLVELARDASRRNRRLSISGMSEGVLALTDLYGVDALFERSDTAQ